MNTLSVCVQRLAPPATLNRTTYNCISEVMGEIARRKERRKNNPIFDEFSPTSACSSTPSYHQSVYLTVLYTFFINNIRGANPGGVGGHDDPSRFWGGDLRGIVEGRWVSTKYYYIV